MVSAATVLRLLRRPPIEVVRAAAGALIVYWIPVHGDSDVWYELETAVLDVGRGERSHYTPSVFSQKARHPP